MNTTTRPATQKQMDLLNRLATERETPVAGKDAREAWMIARTEDLMGQKGTNFSQHSASALIDYLMACPKSALADDLEGMHKIGDTIYKVQRAVHGSGELYAKELILVERDNVEIEDGVWKSITNHRFEYAPGATRHLSPSTKMTLEQAKEFGALYGTCCVCGRTLTNEKSIEDGIGPVCGAKFDA